MNTAFLDTNVLIAWIFLINSFHPKSVDVFNSYSQFFWSFSVVKEFEKKFNVKSKNLIRFFLDLQKFLENPEKDLYSLSDLIDFANERCSKQLLNEVKSSVKPFWSEYLGIQSRIPFFDMKNAIDFCLNDLLLNLDINKRSIEEIMQLSPQRSNDYPQIDALIEFCEIFGATPYLGVKFKYTKWLFLSPDNIERTKKNNYKVEKNYALEYGLEIDEITGLDKQVKF